MADAPDCDIGLLAGDGSVLLDPAGFLAALPLANRLALVAAARAAPAFELVQGSPVAVAPLATARHWQLAWPPLPAAPDAVAVCRLAPAAVPGRVARFGTAFGLSPAQARTVAALYATGDIRTAAAATGIRYNTARDYLEQARKLVWAPGLPRLVTWAVLGTLDADASHESDAAAAMLFALSERQRRLAGLVADGASRAEAAATLGISAAVAKKELAAVFTATGVTSAIGLARLLAELRGLAIITNLPRREEIWPGPASRRISIIAPDGRRVVASDYGPDHARPVLVLHNSMNCRGVDRALVEALQNAGYRPVSPDRPGYGDTDAVPVQASAADYLAACTADVVALCTAMGWGPLPVIAHGPMPVVLALLAGAHELVSRVVVDAPEPDSAHGAKAQGMMAVMKRQFARRPRAVAAGLTILFKLASHSRIAVAMQDWTASSPADARAMANPALLMDFWRKLEPFRRGRIDGLVREQVMQATSGPPPVTPGTTGLTLLIGASDFMHDAQENQDYWRRALPDARITIIPGAGRFISYSHPAHLVAALAG
ncbi:MAG: alpha/beta hydrolase [Sphingomonadales bacterium]|jgi:DNA-binding CsgD family transcriptional regulator